MDFAILNFIQNFIKNPFFDIVMPKITSLGDAGLIWILCGVVLLFSKKYRKGGIVLLMALALGAVLGNMILKPFFARPRPCHIVKDIEMLISVPKGYSFPSGHTLSSMTGAYILTYINKKFGYFAVVLAILIAFSRMYLYVHFFTDIIGGTVIAFIISYTFIKIFKLEKIYH